MSKELLSVANIDAGRLIEQANEALIEANRSLVKNGKGATAKVSIEITIKAVDEDDCFRAVSSKVTVKPPTVVARMEVLPVQRLAGQHGIVVDTDPIPQQSTLPGVSDINAARAVS
jgi:hypothetical protein